MGKGLQDEFQHFGLPGKADGDCDATARLCWNGEDTQSVRQALRAEHNFLMGLREPLIEWSMLVDAVAALSHKLTAEEQVQLDALAAEVPTEDTRATLIEQLRVRVTGRILEGYFVAYSVALGQSFDAKADSRRSIQPAQDDTLAPNLRRNLDLLAADGAISYLYAQLIETMGLLNDIEDPFDEVFPFSEPREYRAQRIIEAHRWAAVRASTLGNLESLIPVIGVGISIPHEFLMKFQIRVRMLLRIAAAYEIDVREGINLYLMVYVMLAANEFPEIQASLVTGLVLPVLKDLLLSARDGAVPTRLIQAVILRSISSIVDLVSIKGAEVLAKASAKAAARGAGKQILGWATFGIIFIADVSLTAYEVNRIGAHIDVSLRPWGSGMLQEGASFLDTRSRIDCVNQLLADGIWADGEAEMGERQLFAGHIARNLYRDGRWLPMIAESEYIAVARIAAEPAAGMRSLSACLNAEFESADKDIRLTLISWYYTMLSIDGVVSGAEEVRYARVVQVLEGGFAEALEEVDLKSIVSRIDALLTPPEWFPAELNELYACAIIEGIDEIEADTVYTVDCAFERRDELPDEQF